jgi:hypothetical protein
MGKLPEYTCPICKLVVVGDLVKKRLDRFDWNCPRCGPYQITGSAEAIVKSRPPVTRLSAWIRDRKESDAKPPVIDSYKLEEIDNLLPKYRASEKQLLLLRALERRSEYPGKIIKIKTETDYPLGWADNVTEFSFLVNGLIGRKLLSHDQLTGQIDSSNLLLQITPYGWEFLEQHEKPSIFSNQAFVAMSFSAELKPTELKRL